MKKLIIIDTDDEKWTHAKVSLAYKDDDGMWADVNYETLPLRPMPEWTINREVAFSNGAPVPDDVVFDFLKEILGENV